MPVVAGCSTAFGCSIDGVVPTAKTVALAKGLADAGVDQIMLADTVGYAHPAQIKEVVRATREAIGDTLYGLHLHDTCGLGIANALVGIEEGIRAFDSCLAGLGGCPYAPGASGNVVTEDLVFMLESMGFATGIDLQKLIDARRLLHEGLPDGADAGPVAEGRHPTHIPRSGIAHVDWLAERIDDLHAVDFLAVAHVFGIQSATAECASSRDDGAVPVRRI